MGGPYKIKKRGKPMTTIYDAAILLVDDNGRPSPRTART